jgi:hypothetical protein
MVQTIVVNISGNDEPEFEDKYPLSDVQAYLESNKTGISLKVTGVPDDDVLDFVYLSGNTDSFKSYEKLYVMLCGKPGLRSGSKNSLHIGLENQLVEAEINNEEIFRDGGSRKIWYTWKGHNGEIFIRSPFTQYPLATIAADLYRHETATLRKLV